MTMTVAVQDELAHVEVRRSSERKAEVCVLLRFAGGLRIMSGRLVIEAELDHAPTARRLHRAIAELYGHDSELKMIPGGPRSRSNRYVLQVLRGGESLARQAGLLDPRGRPTRGLPPAIVSGTAGDAEAVWRGAFLARGSLSEPRRPAALQVLAPGPEAALALVGAGRRLGITAKTHEAGGVNRVIIRDEDAISTLLNRLGAHRTMLVWQQRRNRRAVPAAPNRRASFEDANKRRSVQAAIAAAARVERALQILGEDVPEHLKNAGELRIRHQQASLDELSRLADPPVTKDTIAGRLRRLLALADQRADHEKIPGTDM